MRGNVVCWCWWAILSLWLPMAVCTAAPPESKSLADTLDLDDRPEPLVPVHPETEADRSKIDALSLFAAGRTEEQRGHFATALRLYERALQHDRQSLPILRQIIDVARTLNRKSEYMRYALIAVELDPANLRLVFDLADQLQEQNDFENALKLYSQARAQVADKKSSLYLSLTVQCGRLSYILDRMPQAADAFAEVMAALEKPGEFGLDAAGRKTVLNDEVRSYELFADAFLQANRMDDAQKAFDKVQKLAPNAALYSLHRRRS